MRQPRTQRPAPGSLRDARPAPKSQPPRCGPATAPGSADRLAVEELIHHVLPRLPRVGDRARRGGSACPKEVRLEPVDIDRRTALEERREDIRSAAEAVQKRNDTFLSLRLLLY